MKMFVQEIGKVSEMKTLRLPFLFLHFLRPQIVSPDHRDSCLVR